MCLGPLLSCEFLSGRDYFWTPAILHLPTLLSALQITVRLNPLLPTRSSHLKGMVPWVSLRHQWSLWMSDGDPTDLQAGRNYSTAYDRAPLSIFYFCLCERRQHFSAEVLSPHMQELHAFVHSSFVHSFTCSLIRTLTLIHVFSHSAMHLIGRLTHSFIYSTPTKCCAERCV